MPKRATRKKSTTAKVPVSQVSTPKSFYGATTFRIKTRRSYSVVESYASQNDAWTALFQLSGAKHEIAAESIIALMQDHRKMRTLLVEASTTLDAIINEGLTYSTEKEVESTISAIQKAIHE